MMAYGNQQTKYVMFIAIISRIFTLRQINGIFRAFPWIEISRGWCTSQYVSNDVIRITLVGMKKPKTKIQTTNDLLFSLECQSGAHPTPDSSGAYRPQPNNGGKDKERAYIQIRNNILNICNFSCKAALKCLNSLLSFMARNTMENFRHKAWMPEKDVNQMTKGTRRSYIIVNLETCSHFSSWQGKALHQISFLLPWIGVSKSICNFFSNFFCQFCLCNV